MDAIMAFTIGIVTTYGVYLVLLEAYNADNFEQLAERMF